jgi:beta-lactamase regulating signal transducer with metallopeptidase domain
VIAALSLAAVVGFTLPHVLRLRPAAPLTAAAIWTSALSLRALTVVLAAAWLVLFFPATHLFVVLTHWCWRHLTSTALDGHDVGHVATLLPTLLGLASLASVGLASLKIGRALQSRVAVSLSGGPSDSVVVGGRDIVVAVVGVRRPRVLVSAGALVAFDDDELAAALEHERAHIRRRHRYVLVYAALCGAMARVLPGTRRALDELAFELERDADQAAVAGAVERPALARALVKAHGGSPIEVALEHPESRLDRRVREILGLPSSATDRRARLCRGTAAALVGLVLAIAGSTPVALADGVHSVHSAHAAPAVDDC